MRPQGSMVSQCIANRCQAQPCKKCLHDREKSQLFSKPARKWPRSSMHADACSGTAYSDNWVSFSVAHASCNGNSIQEFS